MVTIKAVVTVGKKPYNFGWLPPTTSFQLQWSVVVAVVGVVVVVVIVVVIRTGGGLARD